MPPLSEDRIACLLQPYLREIPSGLAARLSLYLDLLLRWNARTNLTAIREPEEIVRRHFGESLFAAQCLSPAPNCSTWNNLGRETGTLLDFGSGAGFPGLPIALLHPEIAVTLAESQHKKASFLREAVRTIGVGNVEVWANRAETMPPDRQFDTVTLRAVDNMAVAIAAAAPRAASELILLAGTPPEFPTGFTLQPPIPVPGTHASFIFRAIRA
jgi:16S rRNA (guanine527-N7)-methyltransferase